VAVIFFVGHFSTGPFSVINVRPKPQKQNTLNDWFHEIKVSSWVTEVHQLLPTQLSSPEGNKPPKSSTAANRATRLLCSRSPSMSCFYILGAPRPVACLDADAVHVHAFLCVCVCACVCVRTPLALPGFPRSPFFSQPGVSKF